MSNVSPLLNDRLHDAIASLSTIPVARVTGRLVKVNGLMLQASVADLSLSSAAW